jgi:hypothetical protein
MPAGQFAAKSLRFSDGGRCIVGKDLESLLGVALPHQRLNRQLTFRPSPVRRAAKQNNRGIAKPRELSASEDSRTPKISAQDQDKVGLVRRLGINQKVAQGGENYLPANRCGDDEQKDASRDERGPAARGSALQHLKGRKAAGTLGIRSLTAAPEGARKAKRRNRIKRFLLTTTKLCGEISLAKPCLELAGNDQANSEQTAEQKAN